MNHAAKKSAMPKRKKVLAVGVGAAVAAAALASAAGLGGLTIEKLGAENGVVADAFSDGVTVDWGTPIYQNGTYVVDEVTVARQGVDSLVNGNFATLRDSSDKDLWFVDSRFNTAAGTSTIGANGLVLEAPKKTTATRSKAGALFYTGVRPLADVDIDKVTATYTDVEGSVNDVLVQIPVYVGANPDDLDVVIADNAAGSPIFSTSGADKVKGFSLNPVGSGMTRTATGISFDADTEFNLMPEYTGLAGVDVDGTPATDWQGTLSEFLAAFPNAVTPGLWVNLASNNSTTDDTSATFTSARFAGSSWEFTAAPNLPEGALQITVADDNGDALSTGDMNSDGTKNAETFTISPAIPVSDIGRVSVVMHNVS